MSAAATPSRWSGSRACRGTPATARPIRRPLLHADTFHPTVKAWLFLTDVAADAGPFTYVPGSHRPTPQRLAWERRMSLAAPAFGRRRDPAGVVPHRPGRIARHGAARAAVFAVPANTLVVADTFGFHARGPSAGPLAARRNLGLWQAQPVRAVGRVRPVDRRRAGATQPDRLAVRRPARTRRDQAAPLAVAHRPRCSTRRPSIRPEPFPETRIHGLGSRPIPEIRRAAAAAGARPAAADRCRGARKSSTISAPAPAMSRG